jgi:tetratricopeptide (TPR) repeat protein
MRPSRALLVLGVIAAPPTALVAQIPDSFQNLQVLPKTISRDSLVQIMRGISLSLNVRCQYCHVGGENPNSLRGVEFHKDDDPDKVKARFMMRMLDSLNRVVLAALPERDQPAVVMECKTCHRGWARPQLLTQELARVLDTAGVDAMVARYRALRERAGMQGSFDFGEWEMNLFAERLARGAKLAEAAAVYGLNFEFFPRSPSIAVGLAELAEKMGDTVKAVRLWEKVLELDPENRAAQDRLKKLRTG